MVQTLKINGVLMPTPAYAGWGQSENKIWSTNTGRNNNGKMVGTIVAIKRKLEVAWPITISASDLNKIRTACSNVAVPFFTVEFTDANGTTESMPAYAGDLEYRVDSFGLGYISGASVSIIEQ